MLCQWTSQDALDDLFDVGVCEFCTAPGKLSDVNSVGHDLGQLGVGLHMLEVDGQVIGSILEAVSPQVRRQELSGGLGDVDFHSAQNRLDVLRSRKASDSVANGTVAALVDAGVERFVRPIGPAVDPFA